jgi:hypothetical protein
VINVVTAGGNDQWHGNFGVSFEPGKLQGSPRPSLQAFSAGGVSNLTGNIDFFQPPKDGGVNYFPVGQFSGPIVKGKLWFSGVYAPQVFETTRDISYFSNSIAGNSVANPNGRFINSNGTIRYDQTLRQQYAFVRLDAQPTSNLEPDRAARRSAG